MSHSKGAATAEAATHPEPNITIRFGAKYPTVGAFPGMFVEGCSGREVHLIHIYVYMYTHIFTADKHPGAGDLIPAKKTVAGVK